MSVTSTNLNNELSIGFVGFGEAGFNIAKGLKSAGLTRIFSFDIHRDTPPLGEKIRERAMETGTLLVDTPGELARSAEILFSTVTSDRAREAAEQTAQFLEPRHIYVKGLEALMFECVLAAYPYGADERVFASLAESFPGIDWKKLANYMVGRVVVHGERRAHEMEEVAETLRSLDIEPIMAEATARRQEWCAKLGLSSTFGAEGPKTYREVLEAMASSAWGDRPAVRRPRSGVPK